MIRSRRATTYTPKFRSAEANGRAHAADRKR